MERSRSIPAGDLPEEISALVRRLHETQVRLQELTGGQLDAVIAPNGHPYLLPAAQESLRRSEAAQHDLAVTQTSILNALPAHVALIDQAGVILSVNDGWRRFAAANGLPDSAVGVGRNYLTICEQAGGAAAADACAAANGIRSVLLGTASDFSLEYPCHSPTVPRWFRLMVRPLVQGGAPGAVIMHVDITEQKKMGEAHARLAQAVEHASENIMICDAQARLLYVNPAFETITGYTAREVIGENPRFLQSGKHDAAFYRRMWDVIARGEVWRGHLINRRKDGTLFDEEATITPVRDARGDVVNYVGVKRDVTREMQLEAQFRQAQKMEGIGQLAGGIAHDFNNILAAILMQADLARAHAQVPAPVREHLLGIGSAANRAVNLTRQLLLFSRKQVMQPCPLDLNDAVTNLAKMLRRIIREDIHLQLQLHTAPLWTFGDAGMLDQVLLNLAVNARDAMPRGGTLGIETAETTLAAGEAHPNPEAVPGRYVRLCVTDTGCGIPPEVMPHLFEPFFTTKEVGRGTGLGLATVFGIVKQHRGWIQVSSEVGQGSAFQIFLPAISAPPDAAATGDKSDPAPPGGSETILIVEDDDAVRLLTRLVLERNGYRVLEAANSIAAQEVWRSHQGQIALLLTDLVMPGGVDGRELAARLQHEKPALRVLITSGYSAEIAGRELRLAPGQRFLQKPYPSDLLLQSIHSCLANP